MCLPCRETISGLCEGSNFLLYSTKKKAILTKAESGFYAWGFPKKTTTPRRREPIMEGDSDEEPDRRRKISASTLERNKMIRVIGSLRSCNGVSARLVRIRCQVICRCHLCEFPDGEDLCFHLVLYFNSNGRKYNSNMLFPSIHQATMKRLASIASIAHIV
jgi:hypothetical protein